MKSKGDVGVDMNGKVITMLVLYIQVAFGFRPGRIGIVIEIGISHPRKGNIIS